MERGFEEFSGAELDVGYDYAIDSCGVRVDYAVLKRAGNHAGGIRKARAEAGKKCLPREAATEALRAYEQRNRVRVSSDRFEAYVRSIAKMLSERNPQTKEKRRREREIAEIKAAA